MVCRFVVLGQKGIGWEHMKLPPSHQNLMDSKIGSFVNAMTKILLYKPEKSSIYSWIHQLKLLLIHHQSSLRLTYGQIPATPLLHPNMKYVVLFQRSPTVTTVKCKILSLQIKSKQNLPNHSSGVTKNTGKSSPGNCKSKDRWLPDPLECHWLSRFYWYCELMFVPSSFIDWLLVGFGWYLTTELSYRSEKHVNHIKKTKNKS